MYHWAHTFVQDTANLRESRKKVLLIFDGYSSQIKFKTFKLFQDNGVVVISLPVCSSHVLQPLYLTVIGSNKSYFQDWLNPASLSRSYLNAFDLGFIIHNSYAKELFMPTIREGFVRTGIWIDETCGTDFNVWSW